jgi:hypothetical protein
MIRQSNGILGVDGSKATVFHDGKTFPVGNPHMVIHRKIGCPLVSSTIGGKYSKHSIGIKVKFINIGGVAYCE